MRYLFLFAISICVLSACVPNKKIQLLQKDDVNIKNLPKDSVVRTYVVDTFEYRVQPNDIISVRFESLTPDEYDFFSSAVAQQGGGASLIAGNALLIGELVDENGEIPLPVIGKIKVSEKTVFEIQDLLQQVAIKYIESPVVKVRLLNYRVTVLGEVNREGSILLTNNRVTLLEAIGLSGGFGDLADRENIKLIRQQGGNVTVQYINLLKEDLIGGPYYYVYQNDVLIVPALKQRPFRKYFGQNLALVVSTFSLLLLALNLSL